MKPRYQGTVLMPKMLRMCCAWVWRMPVSQPIHIQVRAL